MKKQIRLLTAAALCANLAFAGAAPGFAAEAAAPAAETESALQAGQELAGEVLNAANEAWKFSGTMEFGDGLLSLMSSDGTDVSWLKSAGVEGVVAGGGDGTADANETISLNCTGEIRCRERQAVFQLPGSEKGTCIRGSEQDLLRHEIRVSVWIRFRT